MLIRDRKILVLGQVMLSIVLLLSCLSAWRKPFPYLETRPILPWSPATEPSASAENPNNLVGLLDQALQRPIFRENRRPFNPTLQVTNPQPTASLPDQQILIMPNTPPPDTSQLSLKGIAINATKNLVLISSTDTPDGTWLALGDLVLGWKIAVIQKNFVHLEHGEQKVVLSLYVDNLKLPVVTP